MTDGGAGDEGQQPDVAGSSSTVDIEGSHKASREHMMQEVAKIEAQRLEERRARQRKDAGFDYGAKQRDREKRKQDAADAIDHLEVVSSKFTLNGGDEFKQMALADGADAEELERRRLAKSRKICEAAELAQIEAEAAALKLEQAEKAASLQAATAKKRKELEEAERLRKRSRPGVRIQLRNVGEGAPGAEAEAAAADIGATVESGSADPRPDPTSGVVVATSGGAIPAVANSASGGLGLGGYDSDEDSDEESA